MGTRDTRLPGAGKPPLRVVTFKVGSLEQPILFPLTDGEGWELRIPLKKIKLSKKEMIERLQKSSQFTIHLCKEPKLGLLKDSTGKFLGSISMRESIAKLREDIKKKVKLAEPNIPDETIDEWLSHFSRRKLIILREVGNPFSPIDHRSLCEFAGTTLEKFNKWLKNNPTASRVCLALNKYHTERDLRRMFLEKLYEGLSRKNKEGKPVWDAQTTALMRIIAEGLGWGARKDEDTSTDEEENRRTRQAMEEIRRSWDTDQWNAWERIIRKGSKIVEEMNKQTIQGN